MARVEVKSAYLIKREFGVGWRWVGQIKYKDAAGQWRTMRKALDDDKGNPILTDADTTDDDNNKVQTTRNIRAARRALEAWRSELDGTPTGGRQEVAEYIRADLKVREGNLQPSSLRRNRDYIPIIEKGLEGVAMRDLTTKRVRQWVQDMRSRGLAQSTIKTAYSILNTVCNRAAENGDIAANPCTHGILRQDMPKALTLEEAEATKPNALDTDGVRRANALLDSTKNGRLRVGGRLALMCGLRASECCGLRWRDVDLDGHTLSIIAAIGRAEGGTYVKGAKTRDSYRWMPIPPTLASELMAWRESQRAKWEKLAEGQRKEVSSFEDCHVVGYADGRFMTPHALSNAWSRLARRGDANGPLLGTRGRPCTFHDLRHTFATHAIASGANVRTVAALVGHADASTTLRIYADALPEQSHTTMDAIGSILAEGSSWAGEGDGATDR